MNKMGLIDTLFELTFEKREFECPVSKRCPLYESEIECRSDVTRAYEKCPYYDLIKIGMGI